MTALLRSTRLLCASLYYMLPCAVPALLRVTALLGSVALVLCTTRLVTGGGKSPRRARCGSKGKIPSLQTQESLGLLPYPVIWPVTPLRRLAPQRLPFCPPLILLLQQQQHPQPNTSQPSYHFAPHTTS